MPAGMPAWLCPKCLLGQAAEAAPGEEAHPTADDLSSPEPGAPQGTANRSAVPGRLQASRTSAEGPPRESGCGGLAEGALPRRLGAYELVELIGRGGMGVVYKARQVSLDRYVAVKVLSLSAQVDKETLHRFRTEAVTAGSLQHPNIVAVHEVGLAEGQHYLVMDYVPGRTLTDLARDGPLPAKRAAQYLRTIAEAVHFAHERSILHRDLKPSNVLIDQSDQPRITDFGLAKRLETGGEVTLSGQVLGSPAYIPPEQASGQRGRIGRRSDVYALGAILYQLLTGRPPFVGETLADILRQVLNENPLRPRLLNPAVPQDLETVCLKCLEHEPDRRYPTAQALAEELGRWLDQKPILARPLGSTGRMWRWCRRKPALAGLIAGLVVAIVGGFLGILSQLERAKAAELTARRHAYAADMNLVQQALEDNDLGRARELLGRHRPSPSTISHRPSTDLRGWEWRYLWARCRGEERFTLCQYSNAVSALAFSPGGKWLAVRWENEVVALWDTTAKQQVAELPAPIGKTWRWRNKALAFSPQGDLLAWGSAEPNGLPLVSLLDLSSKRQPPSLPHTNDVVSLAFSPDAKLLATLSTDGAVLVWDLASGQVVTDLISASIRGTGEKLPAANPVAATAVAEGAEGPAEPDSLSAQKSVMRSQTLTDQCGCVLFSPDGHWLAAGVPQPRVGLRDRRIRLWDWTARKEVEPLPLPATAEGVMALAFSTNSAWLAAGGAFEHNEVYVWDLATRTERRLLGHRGWVTSLAFSPDGRTLASVSVDQTLRLWDVAGGIERRCLAGNTAEVWAIAWSPDGQNLVTGARDGTVRLWDPDAKPTPAYAVLPPTIWYLGFVFWPDSKTLLLVNRGMGGVVESWDTATLQRAAALPFVGANHWGLGLSPDGHWLALTDTNGHIQVWDFPAQRLATNLVIPEAPILGVMFSPGGRYMNAGALTPDRGIITRFWEVPVWREINLPRLDSPKPWGFDYSPREGTVAIGYKDGTAAWWNLATGARTAIFPGLYETQMNVSFSADNQWFATVGLNGVITLWDVATGRSTLIGSSYPTELRALVFSPDGRRLATAGSSSGDLFRLWDVASRRCLLTLPAADRRFYTRLGFSPDGTTLLATSLEGSLLLWRTPSWDEIKAAEREQKTP